MANEEIQPDRTRGARAGTGIALGAAVGFAAGIYAGHLFLYTAVGIWLGFLCDLLFARRVAR